MEYIYGHFTHEQWEKELEHLHSIVHWLLIYKENPDIYIHVDLDDYFTSVLLEFSGLNHLINNPPELIKILSLLEAAKLENEKVDFNFLNYRKLILDIHALISQLGNNNA